MRALFSLRTAAVAWLVVLGLSQAVPAETIRHPNQGTPAFAVDSPSGWRAFIDKDGALRFDRTIQLSGQILILYMLSRPEEVKGRSPAELANQIIAGTAIPRLQDADRDRLRGAEVMLSTPPK